MKIARVMPNRAKRTNKPRLFEGGPKPKRTKGLGKRRAPLSPTPALDPRVTAALIAGDD